MRRRWGPRAWGAAVAPASRGRRREEECREDWRDFLHETQIKGCGIAGTREKSLGLFGGWEGEAEKKDIYWPSDP